MDYSKKLTSDRWRSSSVQGRSVNDEMESDRGRVFTSAAVRRLQQKTQVFPLETNAAVRSRLTHSLEVLQVGRYIGKNILEKLNQNKLPSDSGLLELQEGFISVIEIACLLHDIGNPPFGHFGEKAISLWVEDTVSPMMQKRFSHVSRYDDLLRDLSEFEGNAQGLRILHTLQSLNLTYTQLASLLKYTRPAYESRPEGGDYQYRKKKAGFYFSEETVVNEIRKKLSIEEGCRFPVSYIMEAADDISYCIADLDDALDKGILSAAALHECIVEQWELLRNEENEEVISEGYLVELSNKAIERYETEGFDKNHAYILTLRTTLVNDLVEYVSSRYVRNHEQVFSGAFDEPLIKGEDRFYYATETLKRVASLKIFSSREVESLELKGYSAISGLLKIYSPLIRMEYDDFKQLAQENLSKNNPVEERLYHQLSLKHKGAYLKSVEKLFGKESPSLDDKLLEYYYRVRLVIDYVSGMTDHYALSEYQELSGSA